jgi:hypothetical protein
MIDREKTILKAAHGIRESMIELLTRLCDDVDMLRARLDEQHARLIELEAKRGPGRPKGQ